MSLVNEKTIDSAIDSAINFLIEARDQKGWWKDFFLPAGASDAWVTGFVGTVMAQLSNNHAKQVAEHAWQLLENQCPHQEGWGYTAQVPADADSTLWVLQLAKILGKEGSERAKRGHIFLKRHLDSGGGVMTYEEEEPIRNYIGLPQGLVEFTAWCHPHTCVTAAAASLSELREIVVPYLLAKQQVNGSWSSYWWFADEYSTALALTVVEDPERRARAVYWAQKRLVNLLNSDQAEEFAIAWCVKLLSTYNNTSTLETCWQGVDFLLQHQCHDGSWQPSAKLRVPRPDNFNPQSVDRWKPWSGVFSGLPTLDNILSETLNIYSLDCQGIFTTATALLALHSIRELKR